MKNFNNGMSWLPGTIDECTGPVSFKVLDDGRLLRRHQDHIRVKYCELNSPGNNFSGTELKCNGREPQVQETDLARLPDEPSSGDTEGLQDAVDITDPQMDSWKLEQTDTGTDNIPEPRSSE